MTASRSTLLPKNRTDGGKARLRQLTCPQHRLYRCWNASNPSFKSSATPHRFASSHRVQPLANRCTSFPRSSVDRPAGTPIPRAPAMPSVLPLLWSCAYLDAIQTQPRTVSTCCWACSPERRLAAGQNAGISRTKWAARPFRACTASALCGAAPCLSAQYRQIEWLVASPVVKKCTPLFSVSRVNAIASRLVSTSLEPGFVAVMSHSKPYDGTLR